VPVVLVVVPGSAIYIRFRVRYQSLGLRKRYSAKLLILVVFRGEEQPSRAAKAQYRRNGSTSSAPDVTARHVALSASRMMM
jgi:hypothetical protein